MILQRPGFGLPLDQLPPWNRDDSNHERFPHAIADFFATRGVTIREQRMLDFINQITDKPSWWEKIHNEDIVARWRSEACGNREQQYTSEGHLSVACFDYCLQELRDKASYQEKRDLVHVLDVGATIVKADVDPFDPLRAALQKAVAPLETVPDRLKDWHPGSDHQVLDLLHPSLFPLTYGLSRVWKTGIVPLESAEQYIGLGEVCPVPSALEGGVAIERTISWDNAGSLAPWGRYQWLPSEVHLDGTGKASITSYINNLHYARHPDLYTVLERAVEKAVPLWEDCLSLFTDRLRIHVEECGYPDFIAPEEAMHAVNSDGEDEDEGLDEREREWAVTDRLHDWIQENADHAQIIHPSPKHPYVSFEQRLRDAGRQRLELHKDFPDGLQIIFKLANIHLTPDNAVYSGSRWHVEGALNEHIAATALFYYDSQNITDNYLDFRQQVDAAELAGVPVQNEWEAAVRIWGVQQEGPALQQLGKVLTRPGRWLAFPNVLQHRVGQFGLQDTSKPGHRKILAMFLVDPHIKILSTANVPPQRRDWWAEEVRKIEPLASLPVELFDRIVNVVDDFPVSWEKACETREALMAERGRIADELDNVLAEDTFNFCEH
ncbi:hypothetical protein BAUCODRAFT_467102 [Baudoinia panamericana UAMH 10762]|uniref:Uncharacterized protein n=1 Tax=Baudoinia panamericana (strain UAMH 10762) TaxID=717646 RepID=M2LPA6_BAUPA|nr:uncharacterized protein BAUCODRAFT_467102 [Baudoinia panamericana UAMH 10762]EMC96217.1 hypothetical protein BAUCODRAFT_467102 [Baudoinia panamericana UAMH 10762]